MQIHDLPGGDAIALRLWNTGQRLGAGFDSHLAAAGGSRYTFYVFSAIDRLSTPSQRDLARAVGVDDATITHHLAAMEREGLIERTRAAEDRRILRVTLTAVGVTLWAALNDAVDRYNESQLAGLSPDELERLGELLDRIDSNSERMLAVAPPRAGSVTAPGSR